MKLNHLQNPIVTIDTSRLSYAELVALSKSLDAQIQEKRAEELKVLADGFAKKLVAAGFSVDEGIKALAPYMRQKSRAGNQEHGTTARALYQDPANPANTWSGRGRAARWLTAYEHEGRNREEFRVSSAPSTEG
ncbi:H-NS family nucleoid-associated regulatory protein [Roseateles chitinivorans]|uniref:H-NS histone family protein n=1 Tax=Roseateles chitinivorans TaxID=2917965 RepID=UPI003D6739EC